jgi:hypothetical protein
MKTMQRIGLILGGIVLASVGVLAMLMLWLGAVTGLGVGIAVAAIVISAYALVIGPWARTWGTDGDDARRALPGDELLGEGVPSTTRAIAIDAPPSAVFPWLLQIGYGRGGWYSYDWIDNDGRPSVDRLDPSIHLHVGDRIEMVPGMGPTVVAIDPDRAIVSRGDADAWTLFVEPMDAGCRLISRWRLDWPKSVGTLIWTAIADPGAFVMERKMLLRLKAFAEATKTSGHGNATLDTLGPQPGRAEAR